MPPIVFLDFDGVLRRLDSPPAVFDEDCLAWFEQAVRAGPRVRVVISSTWRLEMPLGEIRSRFSPDVQQMIVGVTPEAPRLTQHYRYYEVLEYIDREPFARVRWIAVDDDPSHFPREAEVVLTDPDRGFDEAAAVELGEWLTANSVDAPRR